MVDCSVKTNSQKADILTMRSVLFKSEDVLSPKEHILGGGGGVQPYG